MRLFTNITDMKNVVLFLAALVMSSCKTSPENKASVTADADSGAVVSVPVAVPGITDSSLQDIEFSDGSIPASWLNAGITDSVGMVGFIRDEQRWIEEDKTDTLLSHVRFPLKSWKTAADFRKVYTDILTPAFRQAIAKQNMRQIFRNQYGAMIADGKIWFVQEGKEFWVSAVNR